MLKTGRIISTLMCLSCVVFSHVSFATVAGTSAPGSSYTDYNQYETNQFVTKGGQPRVLRASPISMSVDPSLVNGGLKICETDASVNGRLNYGIIIKRKYNGKIWASSSSKPFPADDPIGFEGCLTRIDRLGLGWSYHPGKIIYDPYSKVYVYIDSEGNSNVLYPSEGVYYTKNGTYIKAFIDNNIGKWIVVDKAGNKCIFDDDIAYCNIAWKLAEEIDVYGNKNNYWYSDGDYVNNYENRLDSIVSSTGQKVYMYYNPIFKNPDVYGILDSIRVLGVNGSWMTTKYEYLYIDIINPWNECFYDETSNTYRNPYENIRVRCLKRVVYSNNSYVVYNYNQFGEINRIENSNGKINEYAYDSYKYWKKIEDNKIDTCKTRQMTGEMESPDNGITRYNRSYLRKVTVKHTGPDTVIVTESDNTTTKYNVKSQLVKTDTVKIKEDNGLVREVNKLSLTLDTLSRQLVGYKITEGSEVLLDSVVSVIGNKKYIKRFRDYDSFGNPGRIDELGDADDPSDDRYVYKGYLHNQVSSPEVPPVVKLTVPNLSGGPLESFGPQLVEVTYHPLLALRSGTIRLKRDGIVIDSVTLSPGSTTPWRVENWTLDRSETAAENHIVSLAAASDDGYESSLMFPAYRMKSRPILPYYQVGGVWKCKLEYKWAVAPNRTIGNIKVYYDGTHITTLTGGGASGCCTLVVNLPSSGLHNYQFTATENETGQAIWSNKSYILANGNYLTLNLSGADPFYILRVSWTPPAGESINSWLKLYRDGALYRTKYTVKNINVAGYDTFLVSTGFNDNTYFVRTVAEMSGATLTSNSVTVPGSPPPQYLRAPVGDQATESVSAEETILNVSQNQYLDNRILDRVSRTYIKSDTLSPSMLSDTRFAYDQPNTTIYGEITSTPRQWTGTYNLPGALTRVSTWNGANDSIIKEYRYDPVGNLVRSIARRSAALAETTFIRFTPAGTPDKYSFAFPYRSVTHLDNGDSLYTTTEYDTATGLPLSVTDINGYASYFAYDDYGRLIKAAKPGDWVGSWPGWTAAVTPSKVQHYYDIDDPAYYPQASVDSVKQSTSPLVYLTGKTFYDGLGRVIQSQKQGSDGCAIIVNTVYDSLGNVRKVSNPIKTAVLFGTYVTTDYWASQPKKVMQYDALARPVKITYQDGTRDTISYFGNKKIFMDPLNNVSSIVKNGAGRADTVMDAKNQRTIYQHDLLGNLISVTDAAGKISRYYYDILGRLAASDIPDVSSPYTYQGQPVDGLLEYDDLGNIKTKKNSKGVFNYTYDKLSRLVKLDSAGVEKVKYLYDTYTGSNYTPSNTAWINPKGRLVMVVNIGSDTAFYAYDNLGRVRERVVSYAGMTGRKTIKYVYNSIGAVTTIQYPDASDITYNYDQSGRLASVPGFVSSLAYTPISLLDNISYDNGQNIQYTYDDLLRVTQIQSKIGTADIFKLGYQFYDNGNVKNINDLLLSSNNQSFTYDALGQLTKAVIPGQQLGYTYDQVGNRLTEKVSALPDAPAAYQTDAVLPGIVTRYNYQPGTNKLASLTDAYGNTLSSFNHDQTGNVLSRDSKNYSYDYAGRMTGFLCGTTTGEFAYNSAGQRIKKQITAQTVISGGSTTMDAITIPEEYDDLVLKAPDGDSLHDAARDLGQVKFHMNNNFIFFEIDHKYLYGTTQGDYSRIFISLDIDTIEGSGNTYFPENTNTQVLPQAAWEYCLYINSETDYGVYDKWYVKDQNPFQMQVNYIPSHNGKVHIKVPKSRIGNPSHVRFVIMTTKPDFVNPDSLTNGTSTATDVCPGGMTAMTGGRIYSYASFAPPRPGTTITVTTVKTNYYLYEGNQVLCELSPDGSVTSKHVLGLGKVIAKVDAGVYPASGGGKHFFTQDVLGSNRVVTDAYGQIERKTTYTPFGKVLIDEGNTNVSNYLFTGKEWDADEGLYYYGARYYDPDIGRFYAVDPLGSAASSPYAYCSNNPVNYVDPTGMAMMPNIYQDGTVKEGVHGLGGYSGNGSTSGFGSWGGSMRSYMAANPDFYAVVAYNNKISENMFKAARNDYWRTTTTTTSVGNFNTATITRNTETYFNVINESFTTKVSFDVSITPTMYATAGAGDFDAAGGGYTNINLSGGYGLGITLSYLVGANGAEAWVVGVGVVSPGVSGSATKSESNIVGGFGTNWEVQFGGCVQGGTTWNYKGTNPNYKEHGGGVGWPGGVSYGAFMYWIFIK